MNLSNHLSIDEVRSLNDEKLHLEILKMAAQHSYMPYKLELDRRHALIIEKHSKKVSCCTVIVTVMTFIITVATIAKFLMGQQ